MANANANASIANSIVNPIANAIANAFVIADADPSAMTMQTPTISIMPLPT